MSAPTAPRCAKCGNDGRTYDPLTEKGGGLFLTVDCRWRPDTGKWELVERDAGDGGQAFDCLQCDHRTEVEGREEARFPYGDTLTPEGAPVAQEFIDLVVRAKMLLDAFGGDTPDWLRSEATMLERAYEDAKALCPFGVPARGDA